MKLHVNGEILELSHSQTIKDVLKCIGLDNKPVVVELNERAIFPRDYAEKVVNDGDRLEIVTIAAGG